MVTCGDEQIRFIYDSRASSESYTKEDIIFKTSDFGTIKVHDESMIRNESTAIENEF